MELTDNFEGKKAPNKKLFIGAVAVVGIVIIFIFISIISATFTSKEKSPKVQQQSSNSQLINSDNNSNSSLATDSEQLNNWKIYKNSQYSISYPPDWSVEEFATTGGSGVYMKPASDKKDPFTTSLAINVESTSSVPSIQQKQQGYVNFGFKNDSVLLDHLQAARLRGTFPPISKTSTSSGSTKIMEESHIYLSKGSYSYLLVYKYPGRDLNPQFETIFSKMVSSFKFTQ